MIDTPDFNQLHAAFANFGYELRFEPAGDNPLTLVKLEPKRVVVWRTRTAHTLWALLRLLEHERGVR